MIGRLVGEGPAPHFIAHTMRGARVQVEHLSFAFLCTFSFFFDPV